MRYVSISVVRFKRDFECLQKIPDTIDKYATNANHIPFILRSYLLFESLYNYYSIVVYCSHNYVHFVSFYMRSCTSYVFERRVPRQRYRCSYLKSYCMLVCLFERIILERYRDVRKVFYFSFIYIYN